MYEDVKVDVNVEGDVDVNVEGDMYEDANVLDVAACSSS